MTCNCTTHDDYCLICCPPETPEQREKRIRKQIKEDFKYGFKNNIKAVIFYPNGTKGNLTFTSHNSAIDNVGVRYSPTSIYKKKIRLNADLNSLFKWVYGPHIKDIIMSIPNGIKLLPKAGKK